MSVLGTKANYQNAINKAHDLGIAKEIAYLGNGVYQYRCYTIEVGADGDYRCDCMAGQHNNPCYHAAGVHTLRAMQGMIQVEPAPATVKRSIESLVTELWG